MDLKEKLDSEALSKINNVYILDASAILDHPDIENYKEKYKFIKSPALYILTTMTLAELDNNKYKNRGNFKIFTEYLRKYCANGKLSESQLLMNKKDYILYCKKNLRDKDIENKEFNWLSDDYTDKHLLCFVIWLKKICDKTVSIISCDNLIKILCTEASINHVFLELLKKYEPKADGTTDPSLKPELKAPESDLEFKPKNKNIKK